MQRRGLLDLIFQGLFQLLETVKGAVIQQGREKRVAIAKDAGGQRGGKLRLSVLQTFTFQFVLLLQSGKLAL